MTKEEFIAQEVVRAAKEGGYKIDLKLINRCWEAAKESHTRKNTPIRELGLTQRTLTALSNADINTVEDLMKMPETSLLRLRNFGHACLNDIRKSLEKYKKDNPDSCEK